MKKLMFWMALSALSLGLITLAACGEKKPEGGGNTETYAYTQTADDGVTVTAVQGDVTVENGGTVASDKDLTVTATAASGKVELYVNDAFQESPYTFIPTEDVSVRAELYYTVTVKIENPNKIVGRNITLKQDDNRVTLPASLQYLASVRAGKTVTFTASSAGYRDAAATVVADGDKTVTLTLDQFRMEGAAYSNVTEREVEGKIEYDLNTYDSKGQLLNPYVYKGFVDTDWVMSFKVKNITTGQEVAGDGQHDPRYGTISVGAVISYKHDGDYVTMDLRWEPMASAEPKAGYQAISFGGAAWGIVQSTFESKVDPIAIISETLSDPEKAISLEYIRSGSVVYMLVNGVYCASVDLSTFPNVVSDHSGATSFGLFARCSDCTVFDLETARGAEAVAARLAEEQITLPAPQVTGEGCSITLPEGKVFKGQKVDAQIVAADGYMLQSVTYGGEDVSGSVNGTTLTFYAEEGKQLVAVFEQAPLTVKGHIDVKTYTEQIPYTAIQVSGGAATVDSNYDYSIAVKPGTPLELTFTADGFTPVTVSFTAQDETGENVVIDEPVLKTWAASFTKTGHNEYTVAADAGTTFNPTNFQSVSTKYFVIESNVTITTPTTDYGFGFTLYGSSAILVSLSSGVWYAEIICENPAWVLQRQPLSAELSQAMTSAAAAQTPVALKAVRADNILALFINNTYAGSFLVAEYVGIPTISANEATTVGLYERGGAAGKFAEVKYNLNQANAEAVIAAIHPNAALTEVPQNWGMAPSGDGSIKTEDAGVLGVAGYMTGSTAWIMEATISEVQCKNGNKAYFGFFVEGSDNRSIHIYYDGDTETCGIELSQTGGATVKTVAFNEGVDLKTKLTTLVGGSSSIVLKMVRVANTVSVFVDGELVGTVNMTDFGNLASATNNTGYSAKLCACKFTNYSYTIDRIAVANALKND